MYKNQMPSFKDFMGNRTTATDQALFQAIVALSAQDEFASMVPEEIYDHVVKTAPYPDGTYSERSEPSNTNESADTAGG